MATRRWPFGSGPSLINDYTYQVLTDQTSGTSPGWPSITGTFGWR